VRKARYLWRDHARYAEATGLPFKRPRRFPIKTASALRAVLAAGHTAQPGDERSREQAQRRLTQAIMRAYWERDEDISDREVLRSIVSSAGFDGTTLLDIADATAAREELAAITEKAVERGVFGVPTFFVGNEMFWGKDRLDFVERLLQRPE
jgi:2-hydroxychromene-2-carboxylate isomerase